MRRLSRRTLHPSSWPPPLLLVRRLLTKSAAESVDRRLSGPRRVSPRGQQWQSVVGIEVHAQIQSKSKLFSRSSASPLSAVNSSVSFFDAAIPGTLPVMNRRAVEAGVATAAALQCSFNLVSHFDRKHYFYADLPAGYQITQQRKPLATGGRLDFIVLRSAAVPKTYRSSCGIVQLQLEQDSGKSLHSEDRGVSLIDLNRAGVPLMEIVFQPDLSDGEEAAALIKELALILQSVGSCSCAMEDGALRVDANVSVNRPGQPLGVRTEVKNLNSIRSVVRAIEYEVSRQIEALESGGSVENETRSFDAQTKRTSAMRDKEAKQDYRFLPEPNLPPLRLTESDPSPHADMVSVAAVRRGLPELPAQTRDRLISETGLTFESAFRLVDDRSCLHFFLKAIEIYSAHPQVSANLLLNDVLEILNATDSTLKESGVTPEHLASLTQAKVNKELSHNLVIESLSHFHSCGGGGDRGTPSLAALIRARGWERLRDPAAIDAIVARAVGDEANAKLVRQYLRGKDKAFGGIMKRLSGESDKVDMALLSHCLRKRLDSMKEKQ